MQNIVNKAARAIARVVDKLTPEQRDAAFAWALDKLGATSAPKRRKRRAAKTPAAAPASPAPARATAARKPAARKPVRRTTRAQPEPDDDEEVEDDE